MKPRFHEEPFLQVSEQMYTKIGSQKSEEGWETSIHFQTVFNS